MSLVRALLDHTWRLMTLRHDGRGLPKKRSGLLYMLCALLVISGLTQFFASSFRASVIEYALVYGIMIALTISRPVFFSAALLPCIFCNLLYIPLYLFLGKVPVAVDLAIMGWSCIAIWSVWEKMLRKSCV